MNKNLLKKIINKPTLVILVGKSGVGKTTFVKEMNCEKNWFESSKIMKEMLKKENKPVNHDTVHELATKLYKKNPTWQVSNILKFLKNKNFIILDGPRNIKEVKALLKKHKKTIIIKIIVSKEKKFKRLLKREKINKEEFNRILKDEDRQTGLNQILKLADITIINNDSLEEFRKKAQQFKKLLIEKI